MVGRERELRGEGEVREEMLEEREGGREEEKKTGILNKSLGPR